MSQHSDHQHRQDYQSLTGALLDAEHVVEDLIRAITQPSSLFLDPAAIEFLARRARQLVVASRIEAQRGGV